LENNYGYGAKVKETSSSAADSCRVEDATTSPTVNLQLRDEEGKKVRIKVSANQTLASIFEAYAEKKGWPLRSLQFSFRGKVENLDLQSGSLLSVPVVGKEGEEKKDKQSSLCVGEGEWEEGVEQDQEREKGKSVTSEYSKEVKGRGWMTSA
jgi:hypothetical protein